MLELMITDRSEITVRDGPSQSAYFDERERGILPGNWTSTRSHHIKDWASPPKAAPATAPTIGAIA